MTCSRVVQPLTGRRNFNIVPFESLSRRQFQCCSVFSDCVENIVREEENTGYTLLPSGVEFDIVQ